MAKARTLTPVRASGLSEKLPTVECTPEMKEAVKSLAAKYKQEMGGHVSMADIVRWAVQSFIEVKGR